MSERRVIVYGCYGSLCTQKVYLTLAEKGVVAKRRMVNIGPQMENYEPWYASINPRMVIPTLDDDGTLVCDSSVIIRYIDDHFDGPPLRPRDDTERCEMDEWIRRIDRLSLRELSYGSVKGLAIHLRDRLIMPMRLRVLRRHQRRNPDLDAVYQARIDDVEAWIRTTADPVDMAARRTELDDVLDDLNTALEGRRFVVGDAYSLADVMVTVLTARLKLLASIADLGRRPNVLAHYERMKARPAFPADDIAERMDKRRVFQMVAPFLLPRAAAALFGLTAVTVGAWWLAAIP